MSRVRMLHFFKDWWKFIQIHRYYTMALLFSDNLLVCQSGEKYPCHICYNLAALSVVICYLAGFISSSFSMLLYLEPFLSALDMSVFLFCYLTSSFYAFLLDFFLPLFLQSSAILHVLNVPHPLLLSFPDSLYRLSVFPSLRTFVALTIWSFPSFATTTSQCFLNVWCDIGSIKEKL